MAEATIVRAWRQGGQVFVAATVLEAGDDAPTEYIGSVAAEDLAGLTPAQMRGRAAQALKAARDRSLRAATEVSGISGKVTL